jgi:hypothetical protein
MNPHPKEMDSNPPSPGALIEDISDGYKADGERTAGNQRIDIRENFCNRLTEVATTTAKAAVLSTKPAGASTIDGAGVILIGGKDLVTTYFVDST